MGCGCPHAEARDRRQRGIRAERAVLLDANGRVLGRFRTRQEALRRGRRYVAQTGRYARVETPARTGRGRERTHYVNTKRDPMPIPSQAEYERNERTRFYNQLREIERAPLADRKEACREFFEAMRDDPALVAERVSWLLDGNYGFGSYQAAGEVARNTRMNRVAWLTQIIGALEWQCPQRMLIAAWKKLSPSERENLRRYVDRVLQGWLKEQARQAAEGSNGRDPRRRARARRAGRRRDPASYPSTPAGARAYKNRIEAMMRKYPGDSGRSSRSRRSRRT